MRTLAQVKCRGSGQVQCVLIATVYSPEITADAPPTSQQDCMLDLSIHTIVDVLLSIVAASSVTAVCANALPLSEESVWKTIFVAHRMVPSM